MTPSELKSFIEQHPPAKEFYDAGNDAACAKWCTENAPLVPRETRRTYRGLTSSVTGVGADITRRLIVSVRAAAAVDVLVDEMQNTLRSSATDAGIDVSDPETQVAIDGLVAAAIPLGLTESDASEIKSLGLHPQTFTDMDIAAARQA